MNIIATILIGALSIGTYGHVEFIDYDDGWRSVDSEDIPGAEEWYAETEHFLTPKTWRVWRNGHVVTNDFAAPPLNTHIPILMLTVPPSTTYEGVDISDWYSFIYINDDYNRHSIRLPGESDPDPSVVSFFPGIAGITWDSHAGSTNFHYRAYPIEFNTNSVDDVYADRKIFMPRAPSLSQTSRDSLVSTFDAYFERLYYASQGNKNDWETNEWGTTFAGPDFEFSPTNVYIATSPRFYIRYPGSETNAHRRQIDPSTRLLDAPNINRLVEGVKDLFPACLRIEPVPTPVSIPPRDVMDARPFVFRPHWLTDPRDFPREDSYGSSLWWGSSAPYPVMTQVVYRASGSTNIVVITPDQDDLDVIFPTFDWTDLSISNEFEAIDWCLHSIVLDMAIPDMTTFITRGQHTPIPCVELFRALETATHQTVSPIHDLLGEVKTYDMGCTVLGLLTNAFPRAAKTLPNYEKAFNLHRDSIAVPSDSRRMVSNKISIANQLFAVMDRTVHIPSMDIVLTNVRTKVVREGTYSGHGDPVRIEFEIVDDRLVLSGHPDGFVFDFTLDGESSSNSTEEIVRHFVHAEATTPDLQLPTHVSMEMLDVGGPVSIEHGKFRPGTNVVAAIVKDGEGVAPGDGARMNLRLEDGHGNVIGFAHPNPGAAMSFELSAPDEVVANRSYFYEDPREATGSVLLGPTQPGADFMYSGGTCENEYVNLERFSELWIEPDSGDVQTNEFYRWKSGGGKPYFDREELCAEESSLLSQCKDDLNGFMLERLEFSPYEDQSYAPFSGLMTATGGIKCASVKSSAAPNEYPLSENVTNEEYELNFVFTNYVEVIAVRGFSQTATRDVTNVYDVVESYYAMTNGEVVTELAETNFCYVEEGKIAYGERIADHDLDFIETNYLSHVAVREVTRDRDATFEYPVDVSLNIYENTLHPDCKERAYERYRVSRSTRYEDPERDPETSSSTETAYVGEFEFHIDPDVSHEEHSVISTVTLGFDDASSVFTNQTIQTVMKYLVIVADEHGELTEVLKQWLDPITLELCEESVPLPCPVGTWFSRPAMYYDPKFSSSDAGGEKGLYSGDIIFRTMTRTTWPWSAMYLERNNQ